MAHLMGEWRAQVDRRDLFESWSPIGTLRIGGDSLSWQPKGWGVSVWSVPGSSVVGGEVSQPVSPFDLWIETDVTGALGLRLTLDRMSGWAEGPDYREQQYLDSLVASLRGIGARILGEPRSYNFRGSIGGVGGMGLPDLPGLGGFT